jgi:dihydropyrimidinase
MNVDYSAYEGFEVQGFTETVLSRGRVVIEKNSLVTRGGGQFIKRARTGELLR